MTDGFEIAFLNSVHLTVHDLSHIIPSTEPVLNALQPGDGLE
jgi:hypothetical protein